MPRIMIVEDSLELAEALTDLLGAKHQITHAPDVASAKNFLNSRQFDLFIFDVTLPDGSGFDLYQYVIDKKLSKVPVIFLTGQADLADRMKGLELGAQDYILKPFYNKELSLRVEMRLKQSESQNNSMICGDLKFDKELHRVYLLEANKVEKDLTLTPNEYKILSLLASHQGKPLSRTEIVDTVWGAGFTLTDKAVNSHISNLRKKILSQKCQIVSSENKGYMLKISG